MPDEYKAETWPFFMVVRPEIGDVVVSVEGSQLEVSGLKHRVQQTVEDGNAVHHPFLQVNLQARK